MVSLCRLCLTEMESKHSLRIFTTEGKKQLGEAHRHAVGNTGVFKQWLPNFFRQAAGEVLVLDVLGLTAKVLDIMGLDILGTTLYSSPLL